MTYLSYRKLFETCAKRSDEARSRLQKRLGTAREPTKRHLELIVNQQQKLTDILAIYARTGPEDKVNEHLIDNSHIKSSISSWGKDDLPEGRLQETLKTLSKINNVISEQARHEHINAYSDDIKIPLRNIVDVIDEYNRNISNIFVDLMDKNSD